MRAFPSVCITVFVLVLFCSSVSADTSPIYKGRKMLLGSLAFSNSGGDLYEDISGDRQTSIVGSASGGYFVVSNLALGAELSLMRTSYGEQSSTGWGIGPQMLYFIGSAEPKADFEGTVYPFLRAAFLYTRDTTETEFLEEIEETTSSFTTNTTTVSLGGGICVMVSDTLGVILEADYEIDSMKPEGGDSISGNSFQVFARIVAFGY